MRYLENWFLWTWELITRTVSHLSELLDCDAVRQIFFMTRYIVHGDKIDKCLCTAFSLLLSLLRPTSLLFNLISTMYLKLPAISAFLAKMFTSVYLLN